MPDNYFEESTVAVGIIYTIVAIGILATVIAFG